MIRTAIPAEHVETVAALVRESVTRCSSYPDRFHRFCPSSVECATASNLDWFEAGGPCGYCNETGCVVCEPYRSDMPH